MIALLSLAAFAVDPSVYPKEAPVDLPATGVVAVTVPLGLRWPAEPSDGSDLLLVNATGDAVPFAVVRGGASREDVAVQAVPTATPQHWHLTLSGPADGLTIPCDYQTTLAVQVTDAAGAPVAQGLVWTNDATTQSDVLFPATTSGELDVAFTTVQGSANSPSVTAWRRAIDLPPIVIPATATQLYTDEAGTAWSSLTLPQALPIRRVIPMLSEDVFDRESRLIQGTDPAGQQVASGRLYRNALGGGQRAESIGIDVLSAVPGTDLLLGIDAARGAPLTLTGANVEVDAAELVVRDAGAGPFTLYGGATGGRSGTFDLQSAASDLLRAAPPALATGAVVPNPKWVAPEVSGDLLGPGAEVDPGFYHWQRPIQGAPGLAVVDLPDDLLAHALPDLTDLRVLDHDDREIPFRLTRQVSRQQAVQFTRDEVGSESLLRVTLPVADQSLVAVVLGTTASQFDRRVTVGRPGAIGIDPLRTVDWSADGSPLPRSIDVGDRLGDTLLVQIDNGSNAPLPVTSLAIVVPRWSVRFAIPADGARLVYGNLRAEAPYYDLSLLDGQLDQRPAAPATLGAEALVGHPALSTWDLALVVIGLLVTAAGLLVVVVRLVIAAPGEEAPPPAPAKAA